MPTEQIDTTTPAGRLQFHIFGALAEFEREVIRERTRAGVAAARARGRLGGRPPRLTPEKAAMARAAITEGEQSVTAVAKALGVGRTTLLPAPRAAPPTVLRPKISIYMWG